MIAWLVSPPGMMPTLASDRPVDPADTRARLAALARAKVLADAGTEPGENAGSTGPGLHGVGRLLSDPLDEEIVCRYHLHGGQRHLAEIRLQAR